ncbi:PAS domain-containing protein [uncultured Shewanella sp.]|uniref:PAS domain-containing protein n=1 Tax=Shewanella atlantica TaxID=271099 RepID=UPI0026101E83|nr:PAS domain-containing protein [uncultured Shewanella sp.]
MGNTRISKPSIQSPHWSDSLPVKFSIIQFIIASLIIISSVWLLFTIEKSHQLQAQVTLSQNQGLAIVARLQQTTSGIESLAVSMASLGEIYRHNSEVLEQSIPALLDKNGKFDLIAGGGIWPEPGSFDAAKTHHSLFWARNSALELERIDDYNRLNGPGYHSENWYKPTRFYPSGTTYWSETYVDPYTDEAMITASVPMWAEYQFTGASTVDVTLSGLGHFFHQAMNENQGYMFALDHSNKVLVSPIEEGQDTVFDDRALFKPFANFTAENPIYEPINKKLIELDSSLIATSQENPAYNRSQLADLMSTTHVSQREKLTALINLNAKGKPKSTTLVASFELGHDPILGEPTLVSVFLMPKTFWKIVLVTPLSSLNDKANIIAARMGLYLLLMQLAALILLFILQHKLFIRPISRMVNALQGNQVAKLELEAAISKDELGQLARAFISRNQQLEVAFASLDASNLALEEQLTVQRLAQTELKLRKAQLNSLLNSSQNLISIKDIDGSYILINDRFCEIIGVERCNVIGTRDSQIFPSHIAELILKHDRAVLDTQSPLSFEQPIPSVQGEIIYQVTKFPIKDDDGNITSIGSMAFEISSQKLISQELQEKNVSLNLELAKLAHRLSVTEQESHQQQQLINRLEFTILKLNNLQQVEVKNHELFPQLFATLIKQHTREQNSMLSLICNYKAGSEQSNIDEIIDRLTEHTDKLRHFEHLIVSKDMAIKSINLSHYLSHLLVVLDAQLSEQHVEASIDCDSKLTVNGSSWDLLLIFYSLLNNCLSHAFTGSGKPNRISIRAELADEDLLITVEDNGRGIPQDRLKLLKEQLASNAYAGTLSSLNAWLASELSGTLKIDSEFNEFTRVSCRFPHERAGNG